jgi:hypothetical protein
LEHEHQRSGKVGASLEHLETLKAQRLKLQHALERLIDSFTEGLIEKISSHRGWLEPGAALPNSTQR